MDSNSDTQQIIDLLTGITARLDRMERVMGKVLIEVITQPHSPTQPAAGAQHHDGAILHLKLGKLTLKRHAVLTATLGGLSYDQIAQAMGCDVSTAKGHLRNTLQILGIPSRAILLSSHRDMLDGLDDAQYRTQFGLSKHWWTEQIPSEMASLQITKRSANQHTRVKL
ncbi:RNA polymerase sigma factor [Hydrogenophaga sp. OTU3427]|uniref:RNA polymerase sigma factor n=1 Tax=Hydrogenophaga sp. OTU3427 TaxID=3043856 RepID=UPI00313C9EC6